MNYLNLANLPSEHELRNRPLIAIRAEVRNVQTTQWRPLSPGWAISSLPYNHLRGPWLELNEWRAPASTAAA